MQQDPSKRLPKAIDLLLEYRLAHSDVNDPSATAPLGEAITLLQEAVLLSERSDRRKAIVDAVLKLIELLGSGETLYELFKQLIG